MANWIKQNKPWKIDKETVGFNYETSLISSNVENFEELLREQKIKGIEFVFRYFDKEPTDVPFILTNNQDAKLYFDPRPEVGKLRVYLRIPLKTINVAPFLKNNISFAHTYETNTVEFIRDIKQATKIYKKVGKKLLSNGEAVKIDGQQRDIRRSIALLSRYPEAISETLLEQGRTYSKKKRQGLRLRFNEEYQLVSIEYLDITITGALYQDPVHIKPQYGNRLTNMIVLKLRDIVEAYDTLAPDKIETNGSKTKASWRRSIDLLDKANISPDEKLELSKDTVATALGDAYNLSGMPKIQGCDVIYSENYRRKVLKLADRFLTYGDGCISVSPNDFFKDTKFVAIEERKVANFDIRRKNWDSNTNLLDFVGDQALSDILDSSFSISGFDELYDKVLNKISFDTILKKSLECLDVEDICIDAFDPLVLEIPDIFNISDVFGVVSDIVAKGFLITVQEVIVNIVLEAIITLRDCQVQVKELNFGHRTSVEYFKQNLDLVSNKITEKVYAAFDLFDNVGNLSSTKKDDIERFIDDVSAVVTPLEFCSLVSGDASDDVIKSIFTIMDLKYPDIKKAFGDTDKLNNMFIVMGEILDVGVIEAYISPPLDASCRTDEREAARKVLLESKGLKEAEVLSQLEAARERKNRDVEFALSLLNPAKKQEEMTGGDFEKFAKDLVPCTKENENARHMNKVVIDSSVNSLDKIFKDSLSGILKKLEDEAYIMELKTRYLAAEIEYNAQSDSYKCYNSRIIYKQSNGTTNQSITDEDISFYYENKSDPPEGFVPSGGMNPRIEFLKDRLEKSDHTLRKINNTPLQAPMVSLDAAPSEVLKGDYDSVEEMYHETFKESFKEVNKIVSNTFILNRYQSYIDDAFDKLSPSAGDSDLFQNCWLPEGTPVKESILNTFLDLECQTRKSDEFLNAFIAGMIHLYIRAGIIEYILQNIALASDFHFSSVSENFGKDYILSKSSNMNRFLSNTTVLNDFEKLNSDHLKIAMEEVWKIFKKRPSATSDEKNIYRYFVDSIQLVEKERTISIPPKGKFYLYKWSRGGQEKLSLRYNVTGGASPSVITMAEVSIPQTGEDLSNSLKELLLEDKNFTDLFSFCIPLNDILSIITIYNVKSDDANIFKTLFNMILSTLNGVTNLNDFTYELE